jgi:hypothetical protein
MYNISSGQDKQAHEILMRKTRNEPSGKKFIFELRVGSFMQSRHKPCARVCVRWRHNSLSHVNFRQLKIINVKISFNQLRLIFNTDFTHNKCKPNVYTAPVWKQWVVFLIRLNEVTHALLRISNVTD